MKAFKIVPKIHLYDTFSQFHEEFCINEDDLLITHEFIYEPYLKPLGVKAKLLFQEKFGKGEPSDEMIDAMHQAVKGESYSRVIAIGGGSVVDIAKLFALDMPEKVVDLFQNTVPPVKKRKLVILPTTCGTGSEVTNISIAELKSLHTKKGLAVDELFADDAVLVKESLLSLPYEFFVTSSIDALIHASESYLSPEANPMTELYSLGAISMIMKGYKAIISGGKEARFDYLSDFALASLYGGIAFGNAGCGAVHAMSYSIGAAFHVPHGEANYQFFTEIFKTYMAKNPHGKIEKINEIFAIILGVSKEDDVYAALESFLGKLISKKKLSSYGMTLPQIEEFTDSTIANQQRLLANNYVFLNRDEILTIFKTLF